MKRTAEQMSNDIRELLVPILEVLDEAVAQDIVINFSVGANAEKKHVIQTLTTTKSYPIVSAADALMVTFRPDTSFPYLALARQHGCAYSLVLTISDMVEKRYLRGGNQPGLSALAAYVGGPRPLVDAIFYTTQAEHERRQNA